MRRTVSEIINVPYIQEELQESFISQIRSANLSIAEGVALLEGTKLELYREWLK